MDFISFAFFYFGFKLHSIVGLAYQGKGYIVFRFIIEYTSLRDFGSYYVMIIGLFLYEDF
jgi:hypothetical protein